MIVIIRTIMIGMIMIMILNDIDDNDIADHDVDDNDINYYVICVLISRGAKFPSGTFVAFACFPRSRVR